MVMRLFLDVSDVQGLACVAEDIATALRLEGLVGSVPVFRAFDNDWMSVERLHRHGDGVPVDIQAGRMEEVENLLRDIHRQTAIRRH